MRSARESVKGLKKAMVSFGDEKAVVRYDPSLCTVDDLIQAVKRAKGMSAFDAKVKGKK